MGALIIAYHSDKQLQRCSYGLVPKVVIWSYQHAACYVLKNARNLTKQNLSTYLLNPTTLGLG